MMSQEEPRILVRGAQIEDKIFGSVAELQAWRDSDEGALVSILSIDLRAPCIDQPWAHRLLDGALVEHTNPNQVHITTYGSDAVPSMLEAVDWHDAHPAGPPQ